MKTSANYRRVIVAFAERELRTFGGQLLNRTEASALLDRWVLREVLDDEERADLLSRFVAEPPSVPGLDWLPGATVFSDAAEVIKVTLSESPGTVLTAAKVNAAAEAVAVLDEPMPKPKQYRDYEGDLWIEQPDGSYACDPRDGSARCGQVSLASLRRMWGPLEEVKS